jgi:hypothetical protein
MKNRLLVLGLTLAFLAVILAGCSQQTEPEEIYWQYYEACAEGSFNEATLLLSENARETSRILGACGFTHDAINTIELENGNPTRTFSEEPTVNLQDNIASITWFDDQGHIAIVTLVLIDGEWKVTEATWST